MRKPTFCIWKNKGTVTVKLICAFGFLYTNSTILLLTKSKISSHLAIFCACTAWSVSERVWKPRSMCWFLSHLLTAGCDIGVQISVRPFVRPFVRSFVRPSTFTAKFGFLDITDSCESETVHSNCL